MAAGRYFSGLRADRRMRTVMRVSVQASISAAQISANSIRYVSTVFMALPLSHDSVALGHHSGCSHAPSWSLHRDQVRWVLLEFLSRFRNSVSFVGGLDLAKPYRLLGWWGRYPTKLWADQDVNSHHWNGRVARRFNPTRRNPWPRFASHALTAVRVLAQRLIVGGKYDALTRGGKRLHYWRARQRASAKPSTSRRTLRKGRRRLQKSGASAALSEGTRSDRKQRIYGPR